MRLACSIQSPEKTEDQEDDIGQDGIKDNFYYSYNHSLNLDDLNNHVKLRPQSGPDL